MTASQIVIRIPLPKATSTCEVICSYDQICANTYNSVSNRVSVCPNFFNLQEGDERVSASQVPENDDSC